MKRLFALILALVMVFALAAVAFADGDTGESLPSESLPAETGVGSITLNSAGAGTEYAIYRILDLESYNKDVANGAYSYKVNPAWTGFINSDDGKAHIAVDEAGYATWIAGDSDTVVAEFAKKALKYAEDNGIPAVQTYNCEADGTYVFENLPLGWYLVDSNAGALCGLTTTDPDASVNAKNFKPTVDKQVQEDLDSSWGDTNTADIGQIVNYMTIIHVAAGSENYVLHDEMSNGLSFLHDTEEGRGVTEIKHINSSGVETVLVEGTDYTVETTGFADGHNCDFEVVFTDAFIETIKPNDRLLVYYNAMLNRNALVGETGNENMSYLEYGEDHYTTEDKTTTYTFSLDIIKTDSSNKLIDGAVFRIYDAATGGNEVRVVILEYKEATDESEALKDENDNIIYCEGKMVKEIITYRRAREDEAGVPIFVKNGKITVNGFDNGNYYLEEVIAPEGFNKLTARKAFNINGKNLDSIFNGDIYSTGSGVHVVNKTGSMLPETGAMGTVLFISFGMFVALGTGILLVTKKRMSMIED